MSMGKEAALLSHECTGKVAQTMLKSPRFQDGAVERLIVNLGLTEAWKSTCKDRFPTIRVPNSAWYFTWYWLSVATVTFAAPGVRGAEDLTKKKLSFVRRAPDIERS